jgi:hypothetical protein
MWITPSPAGRPAGWTFGDQWLYPGSAPSWKRPTPFYSLMREISEKTAMLDVAWFWKAGAGLLW